MSRTRVRRRRLALIVSGAVIAGAWAGPLARAVAPEAGVRPAATRHVTVATGDTLWAIAERVAPGQDPRPLVDAISAANHLDGGTAIVPGQVLVVPG
jgi:nucleoid-associated protein YgaU